MAALEAARALPEVEGPEILLIDFSPDKRAAHRLAHLLRERGVAVARDIIKRELAGSLAYAKAAAIRYAVILGLEDRPAGTVVVHAVRTDAQRAFSLEAFEREVAAGDTPWRI